MNQTATSRIRKALMSERAPAELRLTTLGEVWLEEYWTFYETKEFGMNRILWVSSVVFCAAAFSTPATEWRPSNDFLYAVKSVESSNGRFKVGDNGQSLGD